MQYTIRFRVRPADLKAIHDRFGPEGIMPIVRDRSRQVLIDDLSAPEIGYDKLFADARVALQASLGEEIASALAEEGFDLTLFTLRDVELGSVGETVQAAARARAELDLEVAAAAVRALRNPLRRRGRGAARRRTRGRGPALPPARVLARPRAALGRPRGAAVGRSACRTDAARCTECLARAGGPSARPMRVPAGSADAVAVESTHRNDRMLELLAVILLGIATVATAWCGFQSSRWNGEETRQARDATDTRLEASRLFGLGTQKVAYDATVAAQYASAYVNHQAALMAFYRQTLVRKDFLPILDAWEAQAAAGKTGFTNLFDDKAYIDQQLAPSRKLEAQAAVDEKASEEAANNGDAYLALTVLMASALFFAGVTTSFRSPGARAMLLAAAALIIAAGAARLSGLPTI